MFGKKAAKEQGALAKAQQAQSDRLIQQADGPTPLQKLYEQNQLDFLDYENGTGSYAGKPRDIADAPGMNPYLELYNNAVAQRADDTQGIGELGMAGQTNPAMMQLIRQNRADRRRESAAGALENAYRMRSAEAHGSVLPLTQLTQSRNMGLAGLASGNANNAWQRYLDQMNKSGFFNSNLYNQLQAGARAAAAGGGG
jgi:hypothetical protein